jgi:hypothetical protein
MRGGSASNILVSGTLLSIFLLLGSLTYVSSDLTRIAAPKTTSRTAIFPPGLYNLTFIQEGFLGPAGATFWLPWSITLSSGTIGNLTESNPSNNLSSISPNFLANDPSLYDQSLATITFLVPYGSYHYEVLTPLGSVFGQVDFSPSNAFPVGIRGWWSFQ